MTKAEKIQRWAKIVHESKMNDFRLNKEVQGYCKNCSLKHTDNDCVHIYIDEIWCDKERIMEATE